MSSKAGEGAEGVLAVAGWHPDSFGVPGWWDGHAWDMDVRGSGQERTWALLSYLSLLVVVLVPAIVLRVTAGRRDRFTRHHTAEVLNAQIWFLVVWFALWIPLFLTGGDEAEPPVGPGSARSSDSWRSFQRQDSRSVPRSRHLGGTGGFIRLL